MEGTEQKAEGEAKKEGEGENRGEEDGEKGKGKGKKGGKGGKRGRSNSDAMDDDYKFIGATAVVKALTEGKAELGGKVPELKALTGKSQHHFCSCLGKSYH